MSRGTYEDFLEAVRKRESGQNYLAVNDYGFAGAYQLGKPALIDAGFVQHPHPGKPATGNDWATAKWTEKAQKLGVNSFADFLGALADKNGMPLWDKHYPLVWSNKLKKKVRSKKQVKKAVMDPSKTATAKKAQDEAAKAFFRVIWENYICGKKLKLDLYVGKEIKGIKLTPSAIVGGYHLLGAGYHKNSDGTKEPGLKAYLGSSGKIDGKDANKTHISQYIALFNDYDTPFMQKNNNLALSVPKPRTNKKRIDKKSDNSQVHPHAAETGTWHHEDYYTRKHWNIAPRHPMPHRIIYTIDI